MKKVNYFLTILFAVALLSTSCEKDDSIVPVPEVPEGITTEDLVGHWDFVSLEIDGTTYTGCSEELRNIYGSYGSISLIILSTTTLGISDPCGDNPDDYYDAEYVLENNEIDWDEGWLIFSIENVDTFNGSKLILKLKDIVGENNNVLIGGIYTLSR